MKINSVLALLPLFAASMLAACDDYETYGDKKEKERDAISAFINDSSIVVISESQFHEQGDSTSVEKNEYVYLNNSGVYMQIVRRGCGSPLEENKAVNILCRYVEYDILDKICMSRNDYESSGYDKMTVTRAAALTRRRSTAASCMPLTALPLFLPDGLCLCLTSTLAVRAAPTTR